MIKININPMIILLIQLQKFGGNVIKAMNGKPKFVIELWEIIVHIVAEDMQLREKLTY